MSARRGPVVRLVVMIAAIGALTLMLCGAPEAGAERRITRGEVDSAPRVLDRTTFVFMEAAEPDRGIASIEVLLEREAAGEGATLVLHADALGSRVAPPRGFRYRPHENAITARELARADEPGRLEVVALGGASGGARRGTFELASPHRFTERAIGVDGELVEANPRTLPSRLSMSCAGLSDGDWTVEVLWDGEPRLTVDLTLGDGGTRGEIRCVRAPHSGFEERLP